MSKLGPNGEPILREDGKVMKGPDYFRPDIAGILEADRRARATTREGDARFEKLAWSVKNEPAFDRLTHAEVQESAELREEEVATAL